MVRLTIDQGANSKTHRTEHGVAPDIFQPECDPAHQWGRLRFVGFGLVARLAPDFNILFLSLPVRLGMVILIYGLIFRYGAVFLDRIMQSMLEECARILA